MNLPFSHNQVIGSNADQLPRAPVGIAANQLRPRADDRRGGQDGVEWVAIASASPGVSVGRLPLPKCTPPCRALDGKTTITLVPKA